MNSPDDSKFIPVAFGLASCFLVLAILSPFIHKASKSEGDIQRNFCSLSNLPNRPSCFLFQFKFLFLAMLLRKVYIDWLSYVFQFARVTLVASLQTKLKTTPFPINSTCYMLKFFIVHFLFLNSILI